MNAPAGISLRASACLLVEIQGKDPVVVARAPGVKPMSAEEPPAAPPPKSGLGGWFSRLSRSKPLPVFSPLDHLIAQAPQLMQTLHQSSGAAKGREVVIAVPAYAHDGQRQGLMDAARQAGWKPTRLVNEPTAASLASGVVRSGDGTVMVYDLAADHFDVTIGRFTGVQFEVLATHGIQGEDTPSNVTERLAQTTVPCRQALQDAGLAESGVDSVALVGALSRQPEVVAFVTELTGTEPFMRFDSEEIIAIGAAVQAGVLQAGAAPK